MSAVMANPQNPSKWRFTWEAQSHIPTLRLLLFDSYTNPSIQCQNLKVILDLPQSLVTVSWFEDLDVSLRVPIPRVLVDADSPVCFRAFDDHIELKLSLILPVDHPIVLNFDSVLDLSENRENEHPYVYKPLLVASDQQSLASSGGVDFYCRSCSFRLTKSPIRSFVEMPSVHWREVADNWFGACCCSFGGASEKLVNRYTNSYTCRRGICLLTSSTITLSKDDLVGCMYPELDEFQEFKTEPAFTAENGSAKANQDLGSNNVYTKKSRFQHSDDELASYVECKNTKEEKSGDGFSDLVSVPGCCDRRESHVLHQVEQCTLQDVRTTSLEDQKPTEILEVQANRKSFLNGFLENIFMVRSSNLSVDIEWTEFFCPQCSSLIGAYPCSNSNAPEDGGIRMFKCYVSTSLPVGGSGDLFSNYTLERMVASQLLECAEESLSFRTVVKDLNSKSPLLQIVLINTNSWSCSAYCSDMECCNESVPKIDLHPVIKVLFSDCSSSEDSQLRTMEDWVAKELADEVFMFKKQIEDFIVALLHRKEILPPSYTSLEGLSLSSLPR